MAGIKSLLKKKTWTGEEVGKLLFASLANDIKMQRGEADAPLLTTEEFDAIAGNLSYNTTQLHIYYAYHDAYKFVIEGFNRCGGLYHQFCHGYYKMYITLHNCLRSNFLQQSLDKSPLIVTKKQYSRLESKTRDYLRSFSASYIDLFFDILNYFLRDDIDDVPGDIKEALDEAKKVSAKGSSYYDAYNKSFYYGYYEFTDGTRSDDFSLDDCIKVLGIKGVGPDSVLSKWMFKTGELFFKGPDYARQFVKETVGKEINLSDEELKNTLQSYIKSGVNSLDDENISKAIELFATGKNNYPTWHYYETPPDDLSLFDMLPLYVDIKNENIDGFKLLKKETPQVFKSLKSYIEGILPSVRKIKAAQYDEPCATWGELADIGCAAYAALTEPDEQQIIDTFYEDGPEGEVARRAGMSFEGIAILQNASGPNINEQGEYEKQTSQFLNAYSSIGFGIDNENNDVIHNCAKGIATSMRYLYCYNTLIDILSDVYKVKDIRIAKYNMDELEGKIYTYNFILYMAYSRVYGSDEESERKRSKIKNAFRDIDCNSFKPSNEAVARVRREMEELGTSDEARRNFQYYDIYVKKLLNEEV